MYCHQIGHQINECPFIENNVRQRIAKHFLNLNPKLVKTNNHGYIELEDLYHDRVKIRNRFKKQIWRDNREEMKAQTVANIVPISIALAPSLLHHKQCWSYLSKNFQFHDGIGKICTIILCGNASVYGYSY
jgi:hypothetical protein